MVACRLLRVHWGRSFLKSVLGNLRLPVARIRWRAGGIRSLRAGIDHSYRIRKCEGPIKKVPRMALADFARIAQSSVGIFTIVAGHCRSKFQDPDSKPHFQYLFTIPLFGGRSGPAIALSLFWSHRLRFASSVIRRTRRMIPMRQRVYLHLCHDGRTRRLDIG